MASKIEPGAPSAPQHRKQVMVESGAFVPVPEEEPKPKPPKVEAPVEEAPKPFKVGDHVALSGRVLEVHSTQGGFVSLKVQLANGAVWLQAEHVEHAPHDK